MYWMTPPYGLGWIHKGLGINPVWTAEPDVDIIERLAREQLSICDPSEKCVVNRLTIVTTNKVYKVETNMGNFVMKVLLPIEMPYKVESEVATTHFLQHELGVPTTRVVAYDPTNSNALRFPWILMDHIVGRNFAAKEWRDIPMIKKERLIKQRAQFHSMLFNYRFSSIGSLTTKFDKERTREDHDTISQGTIAVPLIVMPLLFILLVASPGVALVLFVAYTWYWSHHDVCHRDALTVGRCTTLDFFFADPATPRGPFNSAASWILTRLHDARDRQIAALRPNAPREERQRSAKYLDFTNRVIRCVPKLFDTESTSAQDRMVLFAADLHWGNIIVDVDDDLVAFIDWEFVGTVPTWIAAGLPKIHILRDYSMPLIADYYPYNPDGAYKTCRIEQYWWAVDDYEDTMLRKLFFSEMERLNPEWMKVYREGKQKREFMELVQAAEAVYIFDGGVWDWLAKLEHGESTDGILDRDGYLEV
ncbi:hypothetical protein IAU59_006253 [Kwoniella sp. CBS 9459]